MSARELILLSPYRLPAQNALGPDAVAPFLALGLGYLLQATLSEAMEHENLLEHDVFWQRVQQAIATLAGLPYTPPAVPDTPPSHGDSSHRSEYGDYGTAPP